MKKTMKKITCALLATVSALSCAATMTGCITSHPEVEIEIAFNGNTYTLEYTLYRNVAPATVEHFLYLAGNGYYDGLAVHDYDDTTSRMYTGAYTVNANEATQLTYKNYYDVIKTFENYKDFPCSVWESKDKALPTYTLKGEFKDNHFEVESGALEENFGSLTMYYEHISSSSASSMRVAIERASDNEMDSRDYQYNHTKSEFFISMTTNPKTNDNYCTFATLDKDSVQTLKDLQTAINDYDDEDDFTEEVTMQVFEDETLFSATERKEYEVPKQAIVINKVKVNKY